MKLPLKLTKVPIVDAVFEVRHRSEVPSSSVLPGLLFSQLPGRKTFQKQPAADLPEAFRKADPELRYAPLSGFSWDEKFLVLMSDYSFGLACKRPYPGWSEFRKAILTVVEAVASANILSQIERCSLKYVNIIAPEFGSAYDAVEFNLMVGKKIVQEGHFQLRSEIPEGNLLHIVQIVSEGALQTDGVVRKGAVIDVDTVRQFKDMSPVDFVASLPNSLDEHHLATKGMFFSCLKQSALEKLGPIYE
jgi:uncharacterized protein (TIGR04255 family)